jgi:purine-nucleoside phosphorylase
MTYIVTALKPEAQAFVDRYKLAKSSLGGFVVFSNANVKLIVSGLGVANARAATQALINHYDIADEDVFLNVGICGGSRVYELGELLEIGSILYDSQSHSFDASEKELRCLDEEASSDEYDLVDMESFGFYDAVLHSPAIKSFHIFKVVSDHFEPRSITKEMAKSFIFNVINDINLLIKTKDDK